MDKNIDNSCSDHFYNFNSKTFTSQINAMSDDIYQDLVNHFLEKNISENSFKEFYDNFINSEPFEVVPILNSDTIKNIGLDSRKLKDSYLYSTRLSGLTTHEFQLLRRQILHVKQVELKFPFRIEDGIDVSTSIEDDNYYKTFIASNDQYYLLSSDEEAWVMGSFSVLVKLFIYLNQSNQLLASIYLCSAAPTDGDTKEDIVKKNNAETLLKNSVIRDTLEKSIINSIKFLPYETIIADYDVWPDVKEIYSLTYPANMDITGASVYDTDSYPIGTGYLTHPANDINSILL